ncbi:hypothetical protein HK101_011054, partial [Irineochytrium annulatum]
IAVATGPVLFAPTDPQSCLDGIYGGVVERAARLLDASVKAGVKVACDAATKDACGGLASGVRLEDAGEHAIGPRGVAVRMFVVLQQKPVAEREMGGGSGAAAAVATRVSRRQSAALSSRRQSLMMRTRPSSPAKTYPSRRRVPQERTKYLWDLVRKTFLKKVPDFLSLIAHAAPIPYSLTIRQGFLFKFKLNVKHHIRCMAMHPRVPWHLAEGRVGKDGRKGPGEGDDDDLEVKEQDREDRNEAAGSVKVQKIMPYTFVCVDHFRTVRMWDFARAPTSKPKSVIKLSTDIFQFVFMSRYHMYAGCSDDKSIKFFNPRFELANIQFTPDHVQHIYYNTTTHELITASSHRITCWIMTGVLQKGVVQIELRARHVVESGLPHDEWITGMSIDEKNNKVYAMVNTKVLVYSLSSGDVIDRWFHISHRQITCIIHYDLYHYTVIGCSNGAIKVKNMTDAIVHEFTSHTKPITSLAFYPYGPIVISCALDYSVRMYNLKTFKEVYCTRVTKLTQCKSTGISPRILVRSEDGAIRLLSPVNGKVTAARGDFLVLTLFREVQFHEPLESLCVLNSKGDILLGIQNRIDIVKYVLYLPPGYIKTVESMQLPEKTPESPIPFNENFNFLDSYVSRKQFGVDHHKGQGLAPMHDTFMEMNFINLPNIWADGKSPYFGDGKTVANAWGAYTDESNSYEQVFKRLAALMEQRKAEMMNKRRLLEIEMNEIQKKDDEELDHYNKFKPYDEADDFVPRKITISTTVRPPAYVDEEFLPFNPLLLLQGIQPRVKVPADEIRVIEYVEDLEIPIIEDFRPLSPEGSGPRHDSVEAGTDLNGGAGDGSSPENVTLQTMSIHDIIAEARKEGRIKVAPDGEIPNSVLSGLISEWKLLHKGYEVLGTLMRPSTRKKAKAPVVVEDEKKKKSDAYKAKLKLMLADKEAEAKEKEANVSGGDEVGVANPATQPEVDVQSSGDEKEAEDAEFRPRLANPVALKKFVMYAPPKEAKYPRIIEQALEYSWFPVDEIFFPLQNENPNAKRKPIRKLKVEANGENLLPIALECFKSSDSAANRIEIVEFVNWIFEEYGLQDVTTLVRTYCRHMQGNVFKPMEEADVEDVIEEEEIEKQLLHSRNPVVTLQNPIAQDLAAIINYFVLMAERKVALEQQERLDRIARESKAADDSRLEKERQQALMEFMKKKEYERQLRISQRRDRIAEMQAQRKLRELPKIKRARTSGLFTGQTHQSHCHPSRETLDIALGTRPYQQRF